jgi:4-hydroxy-tetrahydrodipicolinate reductase
MSIAAAPTGLTAAGPHRRVAVAGASGRMGQMLVQGLLADPQFKLVAALDLPSCTALGQDAAQPLGLQSGVAISADLTAGLQKAQVLIDFTRPEGTLAHLRVCREIGCQMVIGTTGFTAEQQAEISAAAKDIAIVMAPNMSVGVNVTLKLLALAAKALSADYDIEITEAHHRHKVDAPSGTALKMGEVIAQAQGRSLDGSAVYARHGNTGARQSGSIGFSVIRGGDIVGDHTVLFAGEGERIEISHKSSSRATYAQGSLRAVQFLATQERGLFDMFDVLGLQ